MSPTPSVTLTDVTHCLYFMSVSLGLETGLFYMPSLTPFTVFHICFPRARGRSMLHTLCDGHQQLLPQVPCGGQRRDAGFAWHWNRRSALPAALAHRRLRLAVRHVPLWLLHGSGWNRYVTVSVLGTVMSLCQSWEPLCYCVGLGNRYVTVSILGTVMSLCRSREPLCHCQSWEPLCYCVGLGNRYVTVSVLGGHNHDRLSD